MSYELRLKLFKAQHLETVWMGCAPGSGPSHSLLFRQLLRTLSAPPACKDCLPLAAARQPVDPAHDHVCGDKDDHQRLDDIDQINRYAALKLHQSGAVAQRTPEDRGWDD